MKTCTVPLDLPFMQFNRYNLGEVLDFLRLSVSYISTKDELWLYPGSTRSQQIFISNFIVQFAPVIFRVFSEAEFHRIFKIQDIHSERARGIS